MVVENQGGFLKRESIPDYQGHTPMPSCSVHMEETLVSVPRPSIGSVMSTKSCIDRLIPYGLGAVIDSRFVRGLWRDLAFLMAHKLSRDDNGLQGSEELSLRSQRSPYPNTSRQYFSGLVFEPSGGFEVAPSCRPSHQILLWSKGRLLSLRTMYVPGNQNREADALSRQGLKPGE